MTARRPSVRHQPIAEGLRELPGSWGRVKNYEWLSAAKAAVRQIEQGALIAYQPAGSFEAEVRIGHDGDAFVWARYLGTAEVAA